MPAPAALNDGMGSLLYQGGTCRFRVWAPFAQRVRVMGDFSGWNAGAIDLVSEGSSGNWSADVPGVTAGQMYKYIIDNVGGPGNDNSKPLEQADARSLQVQSSSSLAASYVLATFQQAGRPAFVTPRFENFILYQLHVGSFSGLNDVTRSPVPNRVARFVDVIDKLDYIKGLGFSGIALLPIGSMFTDLARQGIDEGYEGTSDMFAPEDAYGTSPSTAVAELLQLVDAAHAKGLAVIFDVVYNHSAYSDNRYWRYDGNCYGQSPEDGGIYFEGGHYSPTFGTGFAMWKREVKDFFLDNGRTFLRDYRIDGLRFDATQLIQPDAIEYITGGLRAEFPDKYLIAEYNPGDPDSASGPVDPFGTLNFCATWDLASPGQCYDALSGTDPVNRIVGLVGNFSMPNCWYTVRYLCGSHDQIYDSTGGHLDKRYISERFGGRTNGWALAKARLAWSLNVALPGTPMMFMGTDGALDGWWDPFPTNGEHRVDWARMGDPTGAPMQRLVRDANSARWTYPALRSPAGNLVHTDYQGRVVAFKRYTLDGDNVLVVVNVSDNQWAFHDYFVNMDGESGTWTEIFNSQAEIYGGIGTTGNFNEFINAMNGGILINLPRWSVLMFRKT